MKKIFTLIAVAAMALSANAQQYQLTVGEAPAAGTKITSVANITMTFGAQGDAAFKEVKSNGDDLKAVTGYNAKTDGNGGNPTDGSKSYARGGGAPTVGTFYVFEPTQDGNLQVFIVCNSGKVFSILEDGVNIATSLSAINLKAYDENGSTVDATFDEANRTDTKDTQGLAFDNKVYGTVTFPVKAGKKYHVSCSGSKLGFGGFTFPATATGIESVKASVKATNGATYNVAGQMVDAAAKGLVIKDGKKIINK